MADYIEGKRPVIEALRAQMPLISVLMADNVQQDSQIKDILRKAKQYDVPVKTVPRKVLDERSERGSHQGVMAHAKPYQYSSVTDILKIAERDAEKNNGAALVVLLDHITDAGNLGAIARSVDDQAYYDIREWPARVQDAISVWTGAEPDNPGEAITL